MTAVKLKLTELRKKNSLTQQEVGDALGVSCQTVSKWENQVTMPDISILPALSEYFQVSVDQFLGLVPLTDEYRVAETGKQTYWEEKADWLKNSRRLLWNRDYMEFLIQKVWNIERPVKVLDCGCGCGFLGLLMLPLLPEGSQYTGIDFSETLLLEGKKIFAQEGLKGVFIHGDVMNMSPAGKYDLVVCQEAEASGLYIDGMDYMELCSHDGLRKLWKTEYEKQGRDYAAAVRIPHWMRRHGLREVDVRMNDRVICLLEGQEGYEPALNALIQSEHWDKKKTPGQYEEHIRFFMNHGMNRAETEAFCRKQEEITAYFQEHREDAALTKTGEILISYGRK